MMNNIKSLKNDNSKKIVSDEQYKNAEKDINEKMRIFSINQKVYFNQSTESARTAYLNF